MRTLIAAAFALATVGSISVVPTQAAPVEKVGVCHLDRESGKYEYVEVPAKQFEPTKSGRARGHAMHVAKGYDIVGLSAADCLGKNAKA